MIQKKCQALLLWADNILKHFSYFPQKIGLDILCKLSPKEPIFQEK